MYLFRILRYLVLCLVIVIVILLCFCCVLYNLNRQVLFYEIDTLSLRSKVNAGNLPFILPSTPKSGSVCNRTVYRKAGINLTCLSYGLYFTSNFLV